MTLAVFRSLFARIDLRRLDDMTEVLTVSTATPSREAALRLAESAIKTGLAAAGQVTGPVASVFWHNGEFGQGEEWSVSFKTTATRYAALEAHLIEHHEWNNPEVTAVPLARASAAYVEWVERVTAEKVPHDG
jgi:periplasmic divalent cation tolerance protein